jgi:hypothetical protein
MILSAQTTEHATNISVSTLVRMVCLVEKMPNAPQLVTGQFANVQLGGLVIQQQNVSNVSCYFK